jgi:hypothetical protein
LKCRAIFKGSSETVFHRGSRREPALTFPPEKNERSAPTRRQPHGKFQSPREGKIYLSIARGKIVQHLGLTPSHRWFAMTKAGCKPALPFFAVAH